MSVFSEKDKVAQFLCGVYVHCIWEAGAVGQLWYNSQNAGRVHYRRCHWTHLNLLFFGPERSAEYASIGTQFLGGCMLADVPLEKNILKFRLPVGVPMARGSTIWS